MDFVPSPTPSHAICFFILLLHRVRTLPSRLLVLQDLAAFQHHVSASLFDDFAGALDRDVFALNSDGSIFAQNNGSFAGLDGDLVASLDSEYLPDRQAIVLADGGSSVLRGVLAMIAGDGFGQVGAHADGLPSPYCRALAGADTHRLCCADIDGLGGADVDRLAHSNRLCASQAHGQRLQPTDGDLLGSTYIDHLVDAYVSSSRECNRDRLVGSDGFGAIAADRNLFIRTYRFGSIHSDGDLFIVADFLGPVVSDRAGFVDINIFRAVIDDVAALVVFNLCIHVVLAMDLDQFRAFRIVERKFVVSAATFGTVRFVSAHRLLAGQVPRRHLSRVIGASGDDRTIWIALDKVDDDLLANARYLNASPCFSRPRIRNPYPA